MTAAKLMHDSTNAADIPADATLVAGYINGAYKWKPADWRRFPTAELVRIQVYIPGRSWTDDGDVLDIEAGDAARPEAQRMATAWCSARKRVGVHPCIYTSASTAHHFSHLDCDLWLADYTGQPHLIPGTVATQYASPEHGSGGHYDLSLVVPQWPYRATKVEVPPMADSPQVKQPPASPLVCIRLTKSGNGYWLVGKDGGVFAYGDAGFFGSMGGKPLAAPIESFDVMPNEDGYVMAGVDYGVFAFGSAKFLGNPLS